MIAETRRRFVGHPAHHGGALQPGFGRCCAPTAGVRAMIESPVVSSPDDVAEWLVGRCEHDELDTASKLLLRRVTERAIESTLEPLTTTFAAALERGIDGLPDELRDRLTRAEARRDIGWD